MIVNRTGENYEYEDVTYTVGGRVLANDNSEWQGLYGTVIEIRDGDDRETENDTPDIYCRFEEPFLEDEARKLEDRFSGLYRTEKKIKEWLEKRDIEDPDVDDITDYDQEYMTGLATVLKEVIKEAEGIDFTACMDFDGSTYLIYEPSYPWNVRKYSEKEKELTEWKVEEMLMEYISILTDGQVEVDYQSVENGG